MKKGVKKRKRKLSIFLFIFLLIILVAVCIYFFNGFDFKSKKEPAKKKIKPDKEEIINVVDLNSNKRPIAVMIDNNVGNSSHVGLQNAYITYEIIVEGGLTRIMALFKDKDVSQIGPVRSSRHYFLDYALESDAIYDHYGFSPYAERDIKSLGVNNVNGMTVSNAYWRDSKIRAPHNVFTSIEKSYQSAKKLGYSTNSSDWQLLKYTSLGVDLSKKDPTNVKSANNINIKYSPSQSRSYQYDVDKKVYLRSMNNLRHVDKITGEQYNYKNIIVEKVANRTLDDYGRQDLDTVGSGEGYYITEGYFVPIKWSKSSRKAKTKFSYYDGSEIKFNDGNTFIQVMPDIYDVSIE